MLSVRMNGRQIRWKRGIAIILVCFLIGGCVSEPKEEGLLTKQELEQGRMLAHQYCSNCHRFPEPELLDQATWQRGVLPAMARKLGIDAFNGTFSANGHAALSAAQYKSIVDYYSSMAPVSLKPAKYPCKRAIDLGPFTIKISGGTHPPPPMTTALAFNPVSGELFSADAAHHLIRWDKDLKPYEIATLPSPGTGILFESTSEGKQTLIVTCIGSLMPANVNSGKVLRFNLKGGRLLDPVVLAENLPRTVKVLQGDFNRDGLEDYVVLGFGHDNGGLYFLKQLPNHTFKKEVIRSAPGAIDAVISDSNHDGWPDILCLFAQADEGFWLFTNDHHGGFLTKNIIRFPPIYGSNSFQLVDMNHDGKPDIVYTAGDNADYSPVLKPYHGIYIFTNQGNFTFKQTYFYPINGCEKALAADFDHDGKMDIAAISFFPDFKGHPTEGAVLLEQSGDMKFSSHELPVNHLGRWLVMAVNSGQGNFAPDIALGNFALERGGKPDANAPKAPAPIILLKNKFGDESHP